MQDYRESADGTVIANITIPGRCATKKTHNQIIHIGKKHCLLPSPQYREYERQCEKHLIHHAHHIDYGVGVRVKVWLDNYRIGDHCGYLQSIGDILQHCGVVTNDKYITWLCDGDWIDVDKTNPRTELEIVRLRHPLEKKRTPAKQ